MSGIGFWQEWVGVGLKSCPVQDSTLKKKNWSCANICFALRVSHDDYIKSSGRPTTQYKIEQQAGRFVEEKSKVKKPRG